MSKLGDICTVYAGTGFPIKYQGNANGNYPFYKVGDIAKNVMRGNVFLTLCENYIDEEVCSAIRGTIVPANTVVFAKIGEAVKLNRRAITSSDCLIDNNVMGIKPNESIIHLHYFYHFMCGLKLEKYAEATTVPSVKKTIVEKIDIPLPPLETQHKIAANLDKVTHIIDLCNAILEKLDLLVKSRFVEMFGDCKYTIVKTSDICDFITKGTTPPANEIYEDYSEDRIPFLKVYNLSFTGDLLFKQEPQYISKSTHEGKLSRSKVFPNDVLMNIVGPPLGKFSVVTNEYPEWNINQAIAIFRAKEKVIPQYLMSALMQPDVLRPFLEQAVGIRQLNLSLEQCRNLEIPLPPLALQQQFAAFVEQTDKSKLAVKQVLQKAETLKKALMQEYFG